MHKNYRRRYVIAQTVTFICLIVSGLSFIFKAYSLSTPFVFIWFVLGGAVLGIPACILMYYYRGKQGTDKDRALTAAVGALGAAGKRKK